MVVALFGFLGIFWVLKAEAKARRADVILRVSERWDSDFLRESRRKVTLAGERLSEILKEPGINTKKDYFYLIGVGSFFEELGLLCIGKLMSYEDAYDRFGASIEYYFDLYKAYIDERPQEYPGIFECFEKLYKEIRKLKKQKIKQKL